MLVSNIVPFIAAAAAVFAPAASAWDFKVKWNRKTNCAVKGGPVRYHDRGVCMPLTKTDHGVDVLGHTTGCKMRGWAGGNCEGKAKTAFSSHQCHSLQGLWSVKIDC
ncbi:uncharacterized protein PG998_014907 [Apiospora kogelbergensis]|uniref:Uncharacterized protein n=1 Tax=Apiospora kogelbergensis TaxID=1337665 RepID=A0AAW0Q2Y5_9PEZI